MSERKLVLKVDPIACDGFGLCAELFPERVGLDLWGYPIVDGERWDWKKGSLVLLPMKPGGVEHQHFNLDPGGPSIWVAFVPIALTEHVASQLKQTETSPEYEKG